MLLLIASLAISGAVLTTRANDDIRSRHADDVRLESLWLARSALTAGVTGSTSVETPVGTASVTVSGGTAVVVLEGATATVGGQEWRERFTAR